MRIEDTHVRVVDAVKRFGSTVALGGVDLAVERGRFLVLLGPSGSGKSTLIRILAGVERLTTGQVWLGGSAVADGRHHLPPERRNLAMVFQDYALWPHLTVAGNVGYALRRRKLPPVEAKRRIGDVLEQVGLGRYHERYPHELSGGEQQRVALARAVVARPELLLFDEPLSNLDADLRERLRVEIGRITRDCGATAVYITHDQSEAFALADVIGVLNDGELIQLGTPEEIYRRPVTPFVARFTGLAGELAGRVVDASAGGAGVRVGERAVRTQLIGTAQAGDAVSVLVRPAATRLVADAGSDHAGLGNAIPGVVVDVAYRGRGYDHVVQTEHGTLTSVFAAQARARGTQAAVALDPEGCFAFRTGGAAPVVVPSAECGVTAVRIRA